MLAAFPHDLLSWIIWWHVTERNTSSYSVFALCPQLYVEFIGISYISKLKNAWQFSWNRILSACMS